MLFEMTRHLFRHNRIITAILCRRGQSVLTHKNVRTRNVCSGFTNGIDNIISPLSITKINDGQPLQTVLIRFHSTQPSNHSSKLSHKNKTVLIYLISMVVLVVGMSFAAVPLYRIYCQATGKGGIAVAGDTNVEKIKKMRRVADRVITVHFNADTASSLQWNFKPQQISIKLVPGETALAFYTARNPTKRPVDGVATYNVIPYEAAKYFNKIQCFCFEEQRLNPGEEVDMPVFFYIDPEFMEDPRMETVDDITLSYTFFEAKEGMALPFPVVKKK